jgi:hypothetical protein
LILFTFLGFDHVAKCNSVLTYKFFRMRFAKARSLCEELDRLMSRNEKLSGLEVYRVDVSPYEQHKKEIVDLKGNGIII